MRSEEIETEEETRQKQLRDKEEEDLRAKEAEAAEAKARAEEQRAAEAAKAANAVSDAAPPVEVPEVLLLSLPRLHLNCSAPRDEVQKAKARAKVSLDCFL